MFTIKPMLLRVNGLIGLPPALLKYTGCDIVKELNYVIQFMGLGRTFFELDRIGRYHGVQKG